jgi:tetratricopeptide (TPR) repeat protein
VTNAPHCWHSYNVTLALTTTALNAGARLAQRQHWKLAKFARRLTEERKRLDELRVGDLEVRTGFALSYQGLDDDERRAFAMLSLLDTPDLPAWVVPPLLEVASLQAEELAESLVEAQLLEVVRNDGAEQVRYRFHDLLRVFARERLVHDQAEAARSAALERALRAYCALAEEAAARLEPGRSRIASDDDGSSRQVDYSDTVESISHDPLAWLSFERAGLVAAVRHAYEAELWPLVWRLADSLANFFDIRSHWEDWQHTLDLALDASRQAGNRRAEAAVHRCLGDLYLDQGRFSEALNSFQRALTMFHALGDARGEATGARGLGATYWYLGRFDDALTCFQRCLPVFRELDDRRLEASALVSMGLAYRDQRRFHAALGCFEQGLTIFRELGDRLGEAYTIQSLGLVHLDQGRFDAALGRFEHSLLIFRQVGDRLGEAKTLNSIGKASTGKGDLEAAKNAFAQSSAIFAALGTRTR